jgi:pescadillo
MQVIDRPTQGHRFLSRQYVQPQWVFDSANFRVRIRHQPLRPKSRQLCMCVCVPWWTSPNNGSNAEQSHQAVLTLPQVLADAAKYAPGATLPPHLSPFVKVEAGDDEEHVPDYALELRRLQVPTLTAAWPYG